MSGKIKIHGINVPTESHSLITGLPGAGKTRSILRPLLRQYLSRNADRPEAKVGLLMIDPKGDMVGWLRDLLQSLGRADDLIVIGEGAFGFNLFAGLPLSPLQYASRLSGLANGLSRVTEIRADEEYWHHQQRQMLQALVQVAQIQPRDQPMQIADVVALRFDLLAKLKGSIDSMTPKYRLNELGDAKHVLNDFARLPPDTRECVLSVTGNCLSVFNQPPLVELLNPPSDKSVDLAEIIDRGKCVVVSCATRSYGNGTLPLLQAVKEAFADLVLCRNEIEIDDGKSYRKINAEREILYVCDEAHRVLRRGDDGGELDFLDLSREFKVRAIMATQSISSLQSVMGVIAANRLVSLFGNHFFMSNIDPPTADWAQRMFATASDDSLPPPLLRSKSSSNQQDLRWEGRKPWPD
jgi:hypothetical protein